jgi:succinate dehydrogenase / fumarate reductase membrane anchor subunit
MNFVAWMRNPITDILMGLLLIALFYHAALGLQVIVEDYIHSDFKFAAVIAARLTCFTFGVAGIYATLRIAAIF